MSNAFKKFDPYAFLQSVHDAPANVAKVAKIVEPKPQKFSNISGFSDDIKTCPHSKTPVDSVVEGLGDFEERAAIIKANGVPREWAEGFALFCTMPRPTTIPAPRWQQIVDDGGRFLDRWGKQAAGLGWRAVDVFGVHPKHLDVCSYAMGLVLYIRGREVADIGPDIALIRYAGNVVHPFRRQNISGQAVAIWKLVTNPETTA